MDLCSTDLINRLVDNNLSHPLVISFLQLLEQICKTEHLTFQMNFPLEHPVEECGRVILALLIKSVVSYLQMQLQQIVTFHS